VPVNEGLKKGVKEMFSTCQVLGLNMSVVREEDERW
jgi:hypothetical protein